MAKRATESREVEELAERMLRVLESQRRLGGDAYPPKVGRLAELSGVNASSKKASDAVRTKLFERSAVVTAKRGQPVAGAIVFLASASDLDRVVEEFAPLVLLALLRDIAEKKTPALSIAKLKDLLPAKLQQPFKKAIEDGKKRNTLPPEIGWISNGPTELMFHLSAVQTSGPLLAPETVVQSRSSSVVDDDPPRAHPDPGPDAPRGADAPAMDAQGFAAAFRAAFDRLDRENRATNFVRLLDLRRALPRFDHEQFDRGLRQLRQDDEFTLSGHEGRLGPLTDEEREAGVREVGSLLVYASRRS